MEKIEKGKINLKLSNALAGLVIKAKPKPQPKPALQMLKVPSNDPKIKFEQGLIKLLLTFDSTKEQPSFFRKLSKQLDVGVKVSKEQKNNALNNRAKLRLFI